MAVHIEHAKGFNSNNVVLLMPFNSVTSYQFHQPSFSHCSFSVLTSCLLILWFPPMRIIVGKEMWAPWWMMDEHWALSIEQSFILYAKTHFKVKIQKLFQKHSTFSIRGTCTWILKKKKYTNSKPYTIFAIKWSFYNYYQLPVALVSNAIHHVFSFLLHTLRGGCNCSFEIWKMLTLVSFNISFLFRFSFCIVRLNTEHLNTIHAHRNASSLLLSSYVCFLSFFFYTFDVTKGIPFHDLMLITDLFYYKVLFFHVASSVVAKCIAIFFPSS